MANTNRLNLPLMTVSQSQKYLTYNEAVQTLDALIQPYSLRRGLTTPPSSPDPGDTYIVGIGATGVWSGLDNYFVSWDGSSWDAYAPFPGMHLKNLETQEFVFWDETASPPEWTAYVTSSEAAAFIDLLDTFENYTGRAGQYLRVNATENGLESIALHTSSQLTPSGSPLSITPIALGDGRQNCYYVTSISDDLLIENPTGTPFNFEVMVLRLKSSTIRSLSYDTQYRGSTFLALLDATSGGDKTDYLLFMYNAQDTKWDLLAVNPGF